MVKPGAAVIDVGINRLASGKLAGDVDFEAVREGGRLDNAGARRRRADDGRDADRQHGARRRVLNFASVVERRGRGARGGREGSERFYRKGPTPRVPQISR